METFYKTIEQPSTAEFKDRGSKFLGFVFPVANKDEVKKKINELKELHPKANHHCFAYRIGATNDNYRASDDGEPSGTAGKPILGQIDSQGITNVLIVVVRYFGGTMLGVPGLINAYKTTAAYTLQTALIVQKEIMVNYRLEFDYTQMNDVQKIVKQCRANIIQNEAGLFSAIVVEVPTAEQSFFIQNMERHYNINCMPIK